MNHSDTHFIWEDFIKQHDTLYEFRRMGLISVEEFIRKEKDLIIKTREALGFGSLPED